MNRPPWYGRATKQVEVMLARPRSQPPPTRVAALEPEPPLVMVPNKPCPCEAMEKLLAALGEPESKDWLEHFSQEDRRVIPALRALGFAEAAAQIVADHAVMRKQIRETGQPDYALLARHAAFEDALIKNLGKKILAMRAWHKNEHAQEELHDRWRKSP